jgi:hypothetical protein
VVYQIWEFGKNQEEYGLPACELWVGMWVPEFIISVSSESCHQDAFRRPTYQLPQKLRGNFDVCSKLKEEFQHLMSNLEQGLTNNCSYILVLDQHSLISPWLNMLKSVGSNLVLEQHKHLGQSLNKCQSTLFEDSV